MFKPMHTGGRRIPAAVVLSVSAVLGLLVAGCGEQAEQQAAKSQSSANSDTQNGDQQDNGNKKQDVADGSGKGNSSAKQSGRKPIFGDNRNGSSSGAPDPFLNNSGNDDSKTAGGSGPSRSVKETLKQLQVIVGEWRGITRKAIAGAKGIEEPKWRWDFSNSEQPALAFESKSSSYLRNGRLTYLPQEAQFELTTTTKNGEKKTYRGQFTDPIRDVPADDGKTVHRTFRLTLEQVEPPPKAIEQNYRVEFRQVNNNRYYLITHRKAGDTVQEWDRVANQRSGTSFADKLDDYGEKTCVVSQGLGTMTVSHEGKTYYVCCSGCQKAFEDEPEKWIAAFEEWKRNNRK